MGSCSQRVLVSVLGSVFPECENPLVFILSPFRNRSQSALAQFTLSPLTRKLPLPGIGKYTCKLASADSQLCGHSESPFGNIYYVNAESLSAPRDWEILCQISSADS